jgi:hypothetical protein
MFALQRMVPSHLNSSRAAGRGGFTFKIPHIEVENQASRECAGKLCMPNAPHFARMSGKADSKANMSMKNIRSDLPVTGRAIAAASLARTESGGSYYREDFSGEDSHSRAHIHVGMAEGLLDNSLVVPVG